MNAAILLPCAASTASTGSFDGGFVAVEQ